LTPIALVVAHYARDRAMADGRDQVAIATAVLAVTTEPAEVSGAIAAARPDTAARISVHGLAAPVGQPHASVEQLNAAAAGPMTVDVDGGIALLSPVPRTVVATVAP